MKLRQRKKGHATSMLRGLAIGTIVSISITLTFAVVFAKMIDQEIISWEKIGYGILIVILAASFAGAWISYQKIQHQRLMVCMLTGVAYWIILVGMTALFYKGEYQSFFVTSGIILLGCTGAFLISKPQNRGISARNRRNTHR